MQDDSHGDPPSTARDDVFKRNAGALRRRARSVERSGLQHLERGMMMSSIEALREAVETYRGLGDTTRSESAEQYLALAMYENGEVKEAVQIWEDLVAKGWGPSDDGELPRAALRRTRRHPGGGARLPAARALQTRRVGVFLRVRRSAG